MTLVPGGFIFLDPNATQWKLTTTISAANLDPSILNKLVNDQQGLVMLDQSGNAYNFQ